MAKKAAAYLSSELNTTISLHSIYLKPFKSVVIEDLLVLDQQKDTLLSTPKFIVDLNLLSFEKRIIDVNTVQVNNGSFFLKSYKGKNKGTNLDFIIDYFDSGTTTVKKKNKPYKITFNRVILNNIQLKYKNLNTDTVINGVNFDDVELKNLNGIFEKLNTTDHLVQANIKNLTFKEKSGFYLKNLSAFTTIDSNKIELKKLLLVTNKSRLSDYFEMKFHDYNDFNDYVNKVRMKAHFKNSHLESKDVAYFASEVSKMNLNIDVDGQITGLVNDLRAKKLSVKAGQATYVKGDFNLKGLPQLDETFMEMKVEMASTNKKDLDELVTNITGNRKKVIPVIVQKFGDIYFNGNFTGFQNDFIAFGEFKTKLGRVVSDVNMKINKKGVPSYSGNVKTYDFDLGRLLDENTLGKITASVYVKGKDTELNTLTEQINGDVKYIDFNDYRYSNVKIDGTFDKKYFDGKLSINDKNIQLAFDGGVNLNPKLPVFNFKASIKKAKLRNLHLFKDSLMVDANFSTNFSGTNLNNIQGNLLIDKIRLNNVKGIYNIDSVQLQAKGIGADRTLKINSDVLDASIHGQYDLNTLPSYYKTLAKTYIPSLQADIVHFKNQIFTFQLDIKHFEPLAQLIAPGLEIEDQAELVGNFDSEKNIATLNGFIKKLKYKGVIANNIIIDENTTANQLQAIITSDRVDLNDSLYIKNVNISNILRNDSLALNVKLSNADDANQLDLNGLVEFAKDTTRISILPSLLKINSQDWAIQDKVRINFKNGKTEVSNFDLRNGDQLLTVDGILSEDANDVLKVGFKKFNLTTINPFLKTVGVQLSGKVNGTTKLYGLLKSPKIDDDIKIDSLTLNDTYIGSLTDTSGYNQKTDLINAYMRIDRDGMETFKVDGHVNLKDKDLDLAVKMDDSELAVLSPFVSDLVSKLKGKISTNLTVKGAFDAPKIDGNVTLNNAQVMVNYLKTTYTLSDKINVEHSVINIEDLVLKDTAGNIATANGTVDLNKINTPTLDITIKAKDFMALNTTIKDNELYFGQAYATGTFIFRGPTNKLYIGIDAKTEKGTVFNLPLNTSETVSSKDFITFLSKDTAANVKKATNFDGITMSFKLQVDPSSTANLFTNLGNLSGKGNADLNLEINSLGDFEMSGDYIIESGSFDFTAQEVINKKFNIRQGGTIRWTGNPNQAQIQLKAIYELRASLSDLYTAANRDVSSSNANLRVPVEVEMGLSGLLLKPDIKLDIFFPSNPSIKEELQAYFSDPNNLNLQAFSLIIRRSFAPGAGREDLGKQLTSGVASTATELLFNQFNNVLSSLNLDFVDINIRSLSEASASFKFFNNRIIVNAGVIDNRSTSDLSPIGFSRNSVGSEVEVLALIRKDGTLIGKLANKPPTQQSIFVNTGINPSMNVTSFGLIYSQQFDNFREFVQKMTGKYRKIQKKLQEEKDQQSKKSKQNVVNKDAITEEQKKLQNATPSPSL
ncbi:translocation/assembly module TamB domain-containing protein [Pedobacter cryoconitis]|uniref:Translocation and assembly module TamB C-terminal domain-containing protein n=1 Tax=Pedobacter cryoconitis TaxID=188932 RepID=A0A7X0MIP8_9SPHI|nr:translocation/assembly module TamB domain-containing protein [Pedobacter cryoconitis]MBB6500627.1 hypothetical protein [Pedobacter cryoconitis]